MLTKSVLTLLLLTFVVASCTEEDSFSSDDLRVSELSSETVLNAVTNSAKKSTVGVYEDSDGPPETLMKVEGASSKLTRNANGITANFKTNGLIPGNAYTMWVVIFGDAPGPPVLVTYGAGHVVGKSGKGNFSGHISVNEIFTNPLTAEVHLVIRTHGPVQPDMMPEQINNIDGGCRLPDIGFPSGPVLYPDSDIVGYCANMQIAIHLGS